jgi:hypothetical protein
MGTGSSGAAWNPFRKCFERWHLWRFHAEAAWPRQAQGFVVGVVKDPAGLRRSSTLPEGDALSRSTARVLDPIDVEVSPGPRPAGSPQAVAVAAAGFEDSLGDSDSDSAAGTPKAGAAGPPGPGEAEWAVAKEAGSRAFLCLKAWFSYYLDFSSEACIR